MLTYKQCNNNTSEGTITIYPKLKVDVFETPSKARMRFALAARAMGLTMASCICSHHLFVEKASPNTLDSYLEVCEKTDRYVWILWTEITKLLHQHQLSQSSTIIWAPVLCKVVTSVEKSKYNSKNKYLYFADSTHQDTLWCALLLVYLAMKQLQEGHDIVQRRLGSSFLERKVSSSRSKNAHATAQGTDGHLANVGRQTMQHLMQSRKANTGKQRVYKLSEVDDKKVKQTRII